MASATVVVVLAFSRCPRTPPPRTRPSCCVPRRIRRAPDAERAAAVAVVTHDRRTKTWCRRVYRDETECSVLQPRVTDRWRPSRTVAVLSTGLLATLTPRPAVSQRRAAT